MKNRKVIGVAAISLLAVGINLRVNKVEAASNPSVSYSTHIQNVGDQKVVRDGTIAGSTGRSLRMEALKMNVDNGGIKYQVHGQYYGWQGWKQNGQQAGTKGAARRAEAVKIELTGNVAKTHDVFYRVHGQYYGWQNWKKNGQQAGTTGQSRRMEAIQVKLVEKPDFKTKVTITKVSVSKYEIAIGLTGSGTSAIQKIEVPVWGTTKGQNDIKWYQAKKINDSKYTVTVDAANHKEVGTFNAHVYAHYMDGLKYLGSNTFYYDPNPTIGVTGIDMTVEKQSIAAGQTTKATSTVKPSDATNKSVTYTSSNNQVATIDKNGVITGKSAGKTTISAQTYNGLKKSVEVSVTSNTVVANDLTLSVLSTSLSIGDATKAQATVLPSNTTNKTITFSSSNTQVATINQEGDIVAKSIGTTVITAKTHNGISKSVSVNVNPKIQVPVINVRNISVEWGSPWNDDLLRQGYVGGTDEYGNPLAYEKLSIKQRDPMDTQKSGSYIYDVSYNGVNRQLWVTVKPKIYNRSIVRAEMLRLVNELRVNVGVQPLAYESVLDQASAVRVEELTQVYAHYRPNGESHHTAILELAPNYYDNHLTALENICNRADTEMSDQQLAKYYFDQWKNSPGHYGSMVDKDNKYFGFSISGMQHVDVDGLYAQQYFSGDR